MIEVLGAYQEEGPFFRTAPILVRNGLAVLPLAPVADDGLCRCTRGAACSTPGKHPLLLHGARDASADSAVVRQWMELWPDANVGVVPPPGAVVLDFDPRNDAAGTWWRLRSEYGALPPSLTARTGSGGLHVWLRHRGPARGSLGPGIDVKTSSGYVVVPPSRHTSGGLYGWSLPLRSIAPAPAWLSRLLAPERAKRAAPTVSSHTSSAGLTNLVAAAREGERNNRLMWAACRAHEEGADDAVLTALSDAAQRAGLSELEAARTIASAARTVARTA